MSGVFLWDIVYKRDFFYHVPHENYWGDAFTTQLRFRRQCPRDFNHCKTRWSYFFKRKEITTATRTKNAEKAKIKHFWWSMHMQTRWSVIATAAACVDPAKDLQGKGWRKSRGVCGKSANTDKNLVEIQQNFQQKWIVYVYLWCSLLNCKRSGIRA